MPESRPKYLLRPGPTKEITKLHGAPHRLASACLLRTRTCNRLHPPPRVTPAAQPNWIGLEAPLACSDGGTSNRTRCYVQPLIV